MRFLGVPHPNYLVGGMACSIGLDDVSVINAERLALSANCLSKANNLLNRFTYRSDGHSALLTWIGEPSAVDLGNYLVYGDLPTNGYRDRFKFPSGVILK